ncbi:hypothetical protein GCE86_14125 [Micromonospora terminaliae]|uniref:Uncharacterized protein n=1 Tax=Micromonospora terminaliae TaxID=1914461 RepID=A0AAJ2ZCE3_9ACTN|nr:hypothetical protein [Micromonospora terminaliae]NES27178.1 hypothetical protein [Micromonospora terminaliae]QGL48060.1 hypothetical protein GCE86_14125 [Micromonospora terminaliae]
MNAFLAELGRQLVTRWTAALLLPGALFAAAVVLAEVLGQRHAVDRWALAAWWDGLAAGPAGGPGAGLLLGAAAFLLGAAAAGLVAQSVGVLVSWTWSLAGAGPVVGALTARRRRRWERADAAVLAAERALLADAGDPALRDRTRRAVARRVAVCLVEPARPTWVGDRLHATDVRVHRGYGIDLASGWPRLWLLLPDEARGELAAAQERCGAAARLTGWGLLYAALGAFWWPALVVGLVALPTARYRARLAVAVYADLAEAAVDLYGRDLALQLGLPCPDRLTREIGEQITAIVRKDDVVPRDRRAPAPRRP